MCGFLGFISKPGLYNNDCIDKHLTAMESSITNRGPDSRGEWVDSENGVALLHRRLAVVDVSESGAQPMLSKSGRYVIVFNGEIYNHSKLRETVDSKQSINWQGLSDTETFLFCIETMGFDIALEKAQGMFAFALWDRELRLLTLCRDRFGEKPVYYGWSGQGSKSVFGFSSDLSAFERHSAFNLEIDRGALAGFMRYNNVGGEYSIYKGIKKLLPGHILTVSYSDPFPKSRSWYSAASLLGNRVQSRFQGSPNDAVEVLNNLLIEVVSQQMSADVATGAFLSGGIDSSTIVALMQAQSSNRVSTFSVGFDERSHDEAKYAKLIAKHLNTEHNEIHINASDMLNVIPELPKVYSEPFADSSQIPTYFVSQLARQNVTVSLSGDGGDELFCGYNRHRFATEQWQKIIRMPPSLRQIISSTIDFMPLQNLDWLSEILKVPHLSDKLAKVSALMGANSIESMYRELLSHWRETSDLVIGGSEYHSFLPSLKRDFVGFHPAEKLMAYDLISYLPNDILVKLDRAAMAFGLETRVPFLDSSVVEFAWSLPPDYKLNNGISKWPLKQVLYKYVPEKLLDRPKMGFGIPLGSWLKGPLRDWAETTLNEKKIRSQGYLNSDLIEKKWREHLSGSRNWERQLWNVLVFQMWFDHKSAR